MHRLVEKRRIENHIHGKAEKEIKETIYCDHNFERVNRLELSRARVIELDKRQCLEKELENSWMQT